MQKDTIVKISPILQCQSIPERIRIRLENNFFPNSKKPILLNRKRLKRKIQKMSPVSRTVPKKRRS